MRITVTVVLQFIGSKLQLFPMLRSTSERNLKARVKLHANSYTIKQEVCIGSKVVSNLSQSQLNYLTPVSHCCVYHRLSYKPSCTCEAGKLYNIFNGAYETALVYDNSKPR